MIGQPNTTVCRARITTRMENDSAHAKRLEENPTKRVEFANPELEVAPPNESRTNSPKRACHDDVWTAARISNHCRIFEQSVWKRRGDAMDNPWQTKAGARRRRRHGVRTGRRVNDREGDCTNEMTGATLLRDDVAKTREEEMAWYDKFEACAEVTEKTCP